MELDGVITQKMFDVKTKEDVVAIVANGDDLTTCSRLAIDQVLLNIFNRKCHGTKSLAIEMINGELNGQTIADVDDSGITYVETSEALGMSPEDRFAAIKARVETLVVEMPKYYSYLPKFKSDAELKKLAASDEDIRSSVMDSEIAIVGQGWESKKYYLMKRTKEYISVAQKEGDQLFSSLPIEGLPNDN